MVHSRSALAAVALILAFVASSSAQAQQGEKVGTLTCRLAPSRMAQTASVIGSPSEAYSGVQNRIGLDIGITVGGVLAWGVFAQTATPITRGALAGRYGGASGDIGVGLGVGANVLFGGSNNTISLQPLSLEGSISLNVALGIAGLTLTWVQ